MEINAKMKVCESPFIPSHLTFRKFRISLTFSQSITQQSNNQSNLSIYYNIPKFRILGCYKPSTLKMNLVLEIQRGQKEIGQGQGLLKIHRSSQGVWGATTLRSIVTVPSKLIYSILIVDSVSLPTSWEIPSLWHNLFPQFFCILSSWYGSSMTASSQLMGLAPKLNNYRYLMVVNDLWFLLQEMGLVEPHRISYVWQQLPCTREKLSYHSKV